MIEEKRYKVLLITGRPGDLRFIKQAFRTAASLYDVICIHGYDDGLARLTRERFDALLLDIEHAEGRTEEILAQIRECAGRTSVLVLMGPHNRLVEVKTHHSDTVDYLMKDRIEAELLEWGLRNTIERNNLQKKLAESELRYRLLTESLAAYSYTIKIDQDHITTLSPAPACIIVTGYTSDEFSADPSLWYRSVYGEDQHTVQVLAELMMSGNPVFSLEYRIVHKNGDIRWVKNTALPRYDLRGRLVAYDGHVSDITDRKEAEHAVLRVYKALQASEEKLIQELDSMTRETHHWEATFNAIPNPLFIHDEQFRIIRANRAYWDAAGMSYQDAVGKVYYTVFPKMEDPFRCCVDELPPHHGATSCESEEVADPAAGTIFRSRSCAVRTEDGSPLVFVRILEDIMEKNQSRAAMKWKKDVRANLLQENTRLPADFEDLFFGTVKSLSCAIDAKSHWIAGHSERVTHYALLIGGEMGLAENEIKYLELAGLLHDIGKIAMRDGILEKPAVLTAQEFSIVQKHPQKGVELLHPIKQLHRILPAILHHHERYDGTGYPAGLKGEAIPLWARILAVCDSYDAMTSERPYRQSLGERRAIEEIRYGAGSHFDPSIVDRFFEILKGADTLTPKIVEKENMLHIKEKRSPV